MFEVLGQLNYLAVLVATVVSAAIGGVYFTVLVPKHYIAVLGRQDAPEHDYSVTDRLVPVICILVTTMTSAVLLRALAVTTIGDALLFGLIVGVGYLTAMTFNIANNPNFPHPTYYGLLNAPFFILGSVVTSLILTLWR